MESNLRRFLWKSCPVLWPCFNALCIVCLSRFFYMVAVFFVFRMRFYAAWCGAEASCISAGLGCYPEKSLSKPGGGPTVNYRYRKTHKASVFQEGHLKHGLLKFYTLSIHLFLFVVSMTSALIPPHWRRTTSEPFRTSTATTRTSAWKCDTACATGTWQCSGGCITTSTPTPPSGPTHWGEAQTVQMPTCLDLCLAKLCLHSPCEIGWNGFVSLFACVTTWW